jgi:hypothetical protein
MNYHLRNSVKRAIIRLPGNILRRRASYYILSVAILVGLVWSFNGLRGLLSNSGFALAASDPVIATAGDIACDPTNSNFNSGNGTSGSCREKYTSDLLVNGGFAAVLALGDNQYYCGGYQAFLQSYDPSWGRVKSITYPSVGNHEYLTSGGTGCDPTNAGANGYFQYFGAAAGVKGSGYYSFDVGTWHLIALNSNCGDAGGCNLNSAQGKWLEADLAAHSNFCTLAYWHIPLFSSGGRANGNTLSFWNSLYNHNADVVLSAHDHMYERFAPQTPGGVADSVRGLREFMVGSGGANHTGIPGAIWANSVVRNVDTFGILKLTLHPTSYDWQFIPEAGKTFTDSGTGVCHGATVDTTPPTAPTNLTATAVASNQVNLSWTAGTDNVGVAGYLVFRNGTQIGTTSSTTYVDGTTLAQTTYNYYAITLDGAGLSSPASNTATVTTPAPAPGIALRSATIGTNGAGSTSLVLTTPAGTQLGDVLIAHVVVNSASTVITAPSGWNLILTTTSGSSVEEATFYKAASASEPPSYTWTFGASQPATGAMTGFTNVNTASPIDAFSGKYNSSTATTTFTQITTTAANDMLLAFVGVSGNTTVSPPPGFAEDYDVNNTASGSGKTAEMSQSPKATNGLTSVGTGKEDTLTVSNLTQLIALKASTGTPTPSLTPTVTLTPTITPTTTITPTPSNTSTPTNTSVASNTPTNTSIPTPTNTSAATNTPTNTSVPTSTFTATNTAAPSNTPTNTPTPTATFLVIPTATSTPTPTSAPISTTLTPVADSYIDTSNATANFGTLTQIRVDGSPIVNSYLKFTVPSLSGSSVKQVRLLIYANSASGSGIAAKTVSDNSWGETTINASNAPAMGSTLSTSPAVVTGTWITYDVTSYVTGQGTFSFGLSTAGGTAISLASRESGAHSPQLIVTMNP